MTDDSDSPAASFRTRFEQDRLAGTVRPLAEYLRLFPGEEDAIVEALATRRKQERSTVTDGGGKLIGPYRIERELGRGGQGVVYLAKDTRLQRRVALKVLNSVGMASSEILLRFQREAEVTSKLDHPGIGTVLDSGTEDGVPYLAMKLIEGESLARRIATQKAGGEASTTTLRLTPVTETEAVASSGSAANGPSTDPEIQGVLALIEKAARALHAAHDAGVVHRDIKPGNIMVTPAGEPVVMDFGLARDLDDDGPTLTQTGDLFGTPAYMSPEQLLAKRGHLDARTDVYSLGVTLFECLCLQRPFDAPTREGLYHAIQSKDPLELRRLNAAVSPDLAVVVATAMEKDRDRRYQTALAFAEDLRRVREREPILARPVGRWTKLVRWAQRNPMVASLTAAVFVVLAAGLATTLVQKSRADANAAQAEASATAARQNLAEFERLADGRRLDDLLREQDQDLWPALPSKVPAMESWLDRARELLTKLEGHEMAFADLRARAEPWTDKQRAEDRASHTAELELLLGLEERIAKVETLAKTVPSSTMRESRKEELAERLKNELEQTRNTLAAERARLEPQLSERLTYDFGDPTLEWRHEKLAELVKRLRAFQENGPKEAGVRSVEERLAFASILERRTVLDQQEAWSASLARIAAKDSKYALGTLTLPQVGLIPLGPDPTTGWEEFAETATGEPPVRDPSTGKLVVTEAMGVVLVLLPGGTFWMGAQSRNPNGPNYDPEARSNEGPPGEVTLSPFFLSKYELTQGQWLRSSGVNPSSQAPGANFGGKIGDLRHPVEQVSFEDCQQVLPRVALELPTESQWEYGCRGGTSTPWWVGREREKLQEAANLADAFCKANGGPSSWQYETWEDGYTVHAPVGSFAGNGFGLHDMHGNVYEWCADGFGDYWESSPRAGDGLRFVPAASARANRGGGFNNQAVNARSAHRVKDNPGGRFNFQGVRPSRRIKTP